MDIRGLGQNPSDVRLPVAFESALDRCSDWLGVEVGVLDATADDDDLEMQRGIGDNCPRYR